MENRLNDLLEIALRYNVSDIHFEWSQNETERLSIEMRVNGLMKRLKSQDNDIAFFRYLMYRANLDVSETMRPQTGAFTQIVQMKKISLRFAIVSSYQMMSGVLRILNNHTELNISDLTWDTDVQNWLTQIENHRNGLFLLSGPTGSGKTTTLYTILNQCKNKKIFTLEDPVEVVNEKYIQLQINEAQHLSYSDGIKQLLRHDPDIVMIGEIRDEVVAKMACRTALTGHLVLSTIHSSSVFQTITRMIDLGVNPLELQDVLMGVSNQRLYTTSTNQKIGVYEYITHKQIQDYFIHKEVPNDFISIEKRISEAIAQNQIPIQQVSSDINTI